MTSVSHAKARSLIRAHFALSISSYDERQLRLHLGECASCSARYERHLLVASLDPKAPNAERRLASGLGLKSRRALPAFTGQLSLAVAALAAFAFVIWKNPSEFTPRGTVKESQVFVYQVPAGQPARAVDRMIGAEDELAFAYVNAEGFSKLMIFGEDEHGHIYWYHPAWSNAALNPRAVTIDSGSALRELPEAISHDLDGKTLKIRAIFTNANLSVRDVEQMVERQHLAAPYGSGGAVAFTLGGSKEIQVNLVVK